MANKRSAILLGIVYSFVLAGFGSLDAEAGLVAWWKLDEGSGIIAEDSAGDANGTLINGPVWTGGVVGGALEFNGSDEYVRIDGISGYSECNEITISAWVRPDILSGNRAIYNHDAWTIGSVHFQIAGDNIDLAIGGSVAPYAFAFAVPNQWYHVAGIYSNVNVSGVSKAYVNGSQVYSVPVLQAVKIDLTRAACIGAWLPGDPRFFDGRIDDLRIYDSVISETEIKQLAGFATTPVPNDGATEVSIESELSWQPGAGALSYDVYIDTNNPPTTLIADDIPDATYDPGPLDFNTVYYWQVDENTAGGTITGDVWSFSTVWLTEPVGTVFTFQGRLLDDNVAADGVYDFQFKLFDSEHVGYSEQQGSDVNRPDVDVIDGYFTVELDFGDVFFTGEARWLEIGVRPGDSNDAYTTLRPRQRLTGVPYALREQKQIANLQKQSYASSFDNFSLIEECIRGADVIDCDQKMSVSVDVYEEHPIVLDVIVDKPDPTPDIVTRLEIEKRWRQPAPTIHAFDVHVKVTMDADVHEFSVSPVDAVYNTKTDPQYFGIFHIKASLVRDSRFVLVVKADKIKWVTTESPGYIVRARHVPYEPSASEMQLKVLIKNDGDLTSTYLVTLTEFPDPAIEPVLQQTRTLAEQEEAELTFILRTRGKFRSGAGVLVTMKSPNGKNYDQLWWHFP